MDGRRPCVVCAQWRPGGVALWCCRLPPAVVRVSSQSGLTAAAGARKQSDSQGRHSGTEQGQV